MQLTESQADKLVKSVVDKNGEPIYKSFKDLSDATMTSQDRNEFLGNLNTTLSKQSMIDIIKTKLPFDFSGMWKEGMAIGELEQIRQVLFAKKGEYSQKLDVNSHYKPKTVDQYIGTNWRDRVEMSLSADVIKNAFLTVQGFGDYVSQYMTAMTRTIQLLWSKRYLQMLTTISTIYKIDSNNNDSKVPAKQLGLLLKKSHIISDEWDTAKLPTYLEESNMMLILDTGLKNKIDWDTFTGFFQLGQADAPLTKNLAFYDFGDNGKTLGVLIDKNLAFHLDYRIKEATSQSWAKTMITDFFNHFWVRAARIEFAFAVRIVDKSFSDTAIDPTKSPFSHWVMDDNGNVTGVVKDTAPIRDITNAVNANMSLPQGYELDLESIARMLPTNGDVEKDATKITQWLIDNNLELTTENFKVINVTDNGFDLQAVQGLTNVDSFHDSLHVNVGTWKTATQETDSETDNKSDSKTK